jgi:hypothetical protein
VVRGASGDLFVALVGAGVDSQVPNATGGGVPVRPRAAGADQDRP